MTDLKKLHEAATPAPWTVNGAKIGGGEFADDFVCGPVYLSPDAAFIVALRNAYADGALVEAGVLLDEIASLRLALSFAEDRAIEIGRCKTCKWCFYHKRSNEYECTVMSPTRLVGDDEFCSLYDRFTTK